jgi:hypothetical protein
MASILNPDFVWIPAAATNVMETWRRHGWVPPSEQQSYQQKWKGFKNGQDSSSTGESAEGIRASTQVINKPSL